MPGPLPIAEGITNPPIDDLLTKTDSKYQLVLYSAKRARQINAYYSQLGEGLLEYVGPLVDAHVQEKPLSIALREINDDLLTCEDVDPAELASEEAAAKAAAADAEHHSRRRACVRLGHSPSVCVSRPALISRSAIESGFSWTPVSTSGPTYSSRPSPSCE